MYLLSTGLVTYGSLLTFIGLTIWMLAAHDAFRIASGHGDEIFLRPRALSIVMGIWFMIVYWRRRRCSTSDQLMILVFVVSLAVGVVALSWWIVAEAKRGASPRAVLIRRTISALMAFGLGGLSASYAGLNLAVASLLAIAAAAAMVWYSDSVTE